MIDAMTARQTFPYAYFAFGYPILSEIALPELGPEPGAELTGGYLCEPGADPLRIRLGAVDMDLPSDRGQSQTLQVVPGEIMLSLPGVMRLKFRGANEVLVDPDSTGSPRDRRAYLLSAVFGLIAHLRGFFPLHANALNFAGRAVAIAGRSGAGKSTLAAYFDQHGQPALCDDICSIELDGSGLAPRLWPGIPRIRLWQDAAEALGRSPAGLERVAEGIEKFCWSQTDRAPTEGLPLAAIYVLDSDGNLDAPLIAPLNGSAAVEALMEQTYGHEYLGRIGLAERRFARTLALAREVAVFRVNWRHDFAALACQAEELRVHALGVVAGMPPA